MKHYDTLGVGQDVSQGEIRQAFWKKAKDCHPDHHPDNPSKEAAFKEISVAYAVLSNPTARKRYDQTGEEAPQPDNEVVRVYSIITQTLQQIRAELGENIFHVNIFEMMKQVFDKKIDKATTEAKQMREHVRNVAKLMEKIKYAPGNEQSFIHAALANERQDVRYAIREKRQEILILRKAKTAIVDYSFDREEQPYVGGMFSWRPFVANSTY